MWATCGKPLKPQAPARRRSAVPRGAGPRNNQTGLRQLKRGDVFADSGRHARQEMVEAHERATQAGCLQEALCSFQCETHEATGLRAPGLSANGVRGEVHGLAWRRFPSNPLNLPAESQRPFLAKRLAVVDRSGLCFNDVRMLRGRSPQIPGALP